MSARKSRDDFEKIYALTPLQEGILFHSLQGDAGDAYVVHVRIDLQGELDLARFRQGVTRLVHRHEVLRTEIYTGPGEQPMQLVLRERAAEVSHFDLRTKPEMEQEETIAAYIQTDRTRGFALDRDILFRVAAFDRGADRHAVVLAFHHIILDGWSLGLLYRELLADYHALTEGRQSAVVPGKPFGGYLSWLRGRDRQDARAFWQEYLAGYAELATLTTRRRRADRRYIAADYSVDLPAELTTLVPPLCARLEATPGMFFQCVWGVLLALVCDRDDVVFGAIVNGRPADVPHVEEIVGLFANTLPVRLWLAAGDRFVDVLRSTQADFRRSQRHGYLSLAEIQSCSQSRDYLLDHLFVFENFHLDSGLRSGASSRRAGLTVETTRSYEQTHYPLTVVVAPGEPFRLKFLYDAEVLSTADVERAAAWFGRIAVSAARQPEIKVADLSLVWPEEWRQLMRAGCGPRGMPPSAATLSALLEIRANQHDGPAILEGERSYTAGELNAAANRIGELLRRQWKVGVGDIVALVAERSYAMLVGIFGILKSGAAYLPIDPQVSADRLRYILEDSACTVALAGGPELARRLGEFGLAVFDLQETISLPDAEDPPPAARESDPAYALYTSGSTGRPKCVLIEHASALQVLAHLQTHYPVKAGDAYLLKTSYTFDVSVPEFFGWLQPGGRLAILPAGAEGDPAAIALCSQVNGVTHVNFVPSMLHAILEYIGEDTVNRWPGWRHVMVAGEAFPEEVARVVTAWGRAGNFANLYGPTEAAVYATGFDLDQWAGCGVPIGSALSNLQLIVMSSDGSPRPLGSTGELGIAGPQLARGYLNRPEITHQRFMPSPWLGERVYRTGDLVRMQEGGRVDYLGRRDGQVKIRGHRVELAEIETAALRLPGIRGAAARVWTHNGDSQICLYVVGESVSDMAAVRQALASSLPVYMMPASVVRIGSIPLTSSGKVNRSLLPPPSTEAEKAEPPATFLEWQLAEIWQRVLGRPTIGVCEDFFQLGGHSLNALRICSQVRRDLRREITVRDLFGRPTIRALAALLEQRRSADARRIGPAPAAAAYPVTPAQRQIHAVQEGDPTTIAYNMPVVLELAGPVDGERLERAVAQVVARHDALRMRFVRRAGEVMQEIDPAARLIVARIADATSSIPQLAAAFVKPFALGVAPLLRVLLVERAAERFWLFCDAHHLVADGESLAIVVKDLGRAFAGNPLPPAPRQFQDYVAWRASTAGQHALAQDRAYWQTQFPSGLPRFSVPGDFDESTADDRAGQPGQADVHVDARLSTDVLEACRKHGVTPHLFVLAAYAILLSGRTATEDIVIGVPVSGRATSELDGVVGMFVNVLALRLQPAGDMSFSAFLAEVRDALLAALEHQEFPMEELALTQRLESGWGLEAVTTAVCEFMEAPLDPPHFPGVRTRSLQFRSDRAKFGLKLTGRIRSGLMLGFEYRSACFAPQTVAAFAHRLESILRHAVADPQLLLMQLRNPAAKVQGAAIAAFNEALA